MQKITVGFSRPKKWKPFAWLIMKGYSIPYDHVYISFYSETYDRNLIYQASSTMINFMSPIQFDKENIRIKEFEFEISDSTQVDIVKYCIDNTGIPYGIRQVLGLVWVRLNDLCGKKILNPFRDGRMTEVCCEAVAIILKDFVGITIDIDLDTINPKELYEILDKQYGKME